MRSAYELMTDSELSGSFHSTLFELIISDEKSEKYQNAQKELEYAVDEIRDRGTEIEELLNVEVENQKIYDLI